LPKRESGGGKKKKNAPGSQIKKAEETAEPTHDEGCRKKEDDQETHVATKPGEHRCEHGAELKWGAGRRSVCG